MWVVPSPHCLFLFLLSVSRPAASRPPFSSLPFRFVLGWLASPTCVNIWLKHVKTIPRPRSRESFQRASQNFISRQKTPNDFPPRRISGLWREFANIPSSPLSITRSPRYPRNLLLFVFYDVSFYPPRLFFPSVAFFNSIFIRGFYCWWRTSGTRSLFGFRVLLDVSIKKTRYRFLVLWVNGNEWRGGGRRKDDWAIECTVN